MGFFKPLSAANADRRIARLESLIWVLIYAGLFGFVLGLAIVAYNATLGWSFMAGGGTATALGVGLIFLRSKMKEPP